MSIADRIIERYQKQGTGLADKIISRLQGQSPKAKRLEEANKRAEEARLEAERLNSFTGLAGETFKGIVGMGKNLGKEIIGSTAAVGADVINTVNPLVKPGIVEPIRQVNLFGNEYITPTERERRAKELIVQGDYKRAAGEYGTAALDVVSTVATPFKGVQLLKGGSFTKGFVQGGTAAAPIVAGYGAAGAASEGKDITGIAKDTATGFLAGLAGGGILGGVLAKVGSKVANNPKKDINALEAENIVNEVDEKIGRATTPQEEEVIMELLSRGATREEIVEEVSNTPGLVSRQKTETPKTEEPKPTPDEDNFLKAVEERFKASKREKFREATKDEKGKFTGSTGDESWQKRDELAQSIQNRIDAIKDDSIVGFAAREDLKALQERVASVKPSELTKLSGEAEKIANDYLQMQAEKVRPVIEKEKKIATVKTIAQESESFSEFQLNLKKRGEEITKLFKSKPAAEEFYQRASGVKYRIADEEPLLQEARKYNSAEEFIASRQPKTVKFTSAKQKADYMGGHEAPMAEDINAPIWDLNGKYTGNNLYPEDIYSHDAARMYSSGSDADPQAISILQSLKGRPNKRVTVYRAVPKEVKGELNPGDWVTLTKEYAKEHGESNLNGQFKIIKKEVFARDIFTDANSVQEFGYDPQPRLDPKDTPYELLSKAYKEGKVDMHSQYQAQLTDLWKKAQGKFRTDETIPKSLTDETEAGYQVRSEMEVATAGSREIIDYGMDRSVISTSSTFPKWVSPEYRSRDLFDKVLQHIQDGTVPKSSRQLGLYKEVKEEMLRRANKFGERFEQLTGKKITSEQESQIKALNKKLFGDENVEVTAQLMTPNGQKAFGEYKNKVIKILEGQADPTDTFYHEAVHKYLDLFTTLDEQKKIYLEARKLWKTDNLDDLEEQIAENFIRYAKTNEGVVGTMKVLFDKVIDRIKAALKGESQIEALYKDILEGKAARKSETTGVSKVAKSVEAKTVEKGLSEGFDGLAGYTKITIKEQAEKMAKLMSEDIEKAKSLLDGEDLPDGIRGETVIKAMEDYAMKTGDAELALRVANSPLTSETSVHAQAMRLLAERNPESAVAKIQEVKKEREKRFESKGKKVSEAKKEAVDEIKKKIKQPVPTEKDWDEFIESIKC